MRALVFNRTSEITNAPQLTRNRARCCLNGVGIQSSSVTPKFYSLSRIQEFAPPRDVESVSAATLTSEDFRRNFIDKFRPCRIVGALEHWPAMRLWKSDEYLIGRVGKEKEVAVSTSPLFESPNEEQLKHNLGSYLKMSFGDFMERASAPGSGHTVLYSHRVSEPNGYETKFANAHPLAPRHVEPDLRELFPDVDGFPFLADARPSLRYPAYRAFVFRNAFTDWHFHPMDDALMCQVDGAKEVLLTPPDEKSHALLSGLTKEYGGTFTKDVASRFAGAEIYRAVVNPGDALYIPVYWWHAVEALEDRRGITIAATFRTPMAISGDLRYPAARELVKSLFATSETGIAGALTKLRAGGVVAGAVTLSHLHRARQALKR